MGINDTLRLAFTVALPPNCDQLTLVRECTGIYPTMNYSNRLHPPYNFSDAQVVLKNKGHFKFRLEVYLFNKQTFQLEMDSAVIDIDVS